MHCVTSLCGVHRKRPFSMCCHLCCNVMHTCMYEHVSASTCGCMAMQLVLLQVGSKVVGGVLGLYRALRRHDAADRALLRGMTAMLRELRLYHSSLLQAFLQDTHVLYRQEGLELVATLSAADYLEHCEKRIAEEGAWCSELLEAGTRAPLLEAVQAELLVPHFTALLAAGLPAMLAEARHEDLARLLRLARALHALSLHLL